MKFALYALAAALFAAAAPAAAQSPSAETEAPAGEYRLDPTHATVIFRVNHLGFARYVGQFTGVEAVLHFDPDAPETMRVEAEIDSRSLLLTNPPEGFVDLLLSAEWLDADAFPAMRFSSTSVEITGPGTALVHGDLTLRGVTHPLALETAFNGGYAGHPYDPNARIGFSAQGTLLRSDYGIDLGIPEPGSDMGVGDGVEILIEVEFTGPPYEPGE